MRFLAPDRALGLEWGVKYPQEWAQVLSPRQKYGVPARRRDPIKIAAGVPIAALATGNADHLGQEHSVPELAAHVHGVA